MKYPKSVFFIVISIFCERFSYYGIKTILPLYVIEVLQYSEVTSTAIYHTFSMLAFFFPLIGAIVADSWIGKYRTILYLSLVSLFGYLLLSASSAPWFPLPIRETSFLGLFLIAFSAGGIKPCITSFGGEQFKLPEQEAHLSKYFSVYFFFILCGIFLSTIITPILRKDETCFDLNTCYPLGFFVPSIFMLLALAIFVGGNRKYKHKNPEGNVLLKVTKCIGHAIRRKVNSREKRKHWLDYADDAYDHKVIDDTKAALKVLKLYIPLPIYWALYDQQGSRWTFQATRTNGEFFGYIIKPDQFQVVNSVLAISLLPLFEWIINPIIEKFLFINTPLRKLTVGGVLTATSFVVSGLLELRLESTYAIQPSAGLAQLRIFNTFNCPASLFLNGQNYQLEAFGMYQNLSIPVISNESLSFDLKVACRSDNPVQYTGSIKIEENEAISYLLNNNGLLTRFSDAIEKSRSGDAMVRAFIFTDTGTPTNFSIHLDDSKSYQLKLREDNFNTNFAVVKHNYYNISIHGILVARNVPLKSGGVYTIIGRVNSNGTVDIKTITVVEHNSVHMFWLLPQFFLITVGQILFTVTGMQFVFTQAPASMKSVLQAIWLLNTAIGNLLIVIVAKAHFFHRQVLEFFLFAGIMYVDMIIFAIMAMSYKYVDNSTNRILTYEHIELKHHNESTVKMFEEENHENSHAEHEQN